MALEGGLEMLETSQKGLGAFLKALQGVGAMKNAPCPHPHQSPAVLCVPLNKINQSEV